MHSWNTGRGPINVKTALKYAIVTFTSPTLTDRRRDGQMPTITQPLRRAEVKSRVGLSDIRKNVAFQFIMNGHSLLASGQMGFILLPGVEQVET